MLLWLFLVLLLSSAKTIQHTGLRCASNTQKRQAEVLARTAASHTAEETGMCFGMGLRSTARPPRALSPEPTTVHRDKSGRRIDPKLAKLQQREEERKQQEKDEARARWGGGFVGDQE